MNWNNMSVLAAVTLLVLAALAPMAVSAEPADLDSSAPNNADAGDEVKVSFSLTNTGNNDSSYILNVDQIPDDWEIVDREDDGGTWKETNTRWLYQTIEPDETKSPSLTLKIPDDEDTGDYTVSALVKDNDDDRRDTTSETISVQGDETPTPTPETPTEPTPTPTPTDGTPTPTLTFAGDDDDDDDDETATPPPETPTEETPTPTADTPTPTEETPTPTADTPTPTEETPTDTFESPSETPDDDDGISTFLIVFVVLIVVAAAAAAAYYFLVVQE
jgi:hypothetical protein